MNEKERAIMNLLVEAHNQYMLLEPTHPDDRRDWCNALHNVQDILNRRILRRDYPKDFSTYPDNKIKEENITEPPVIFKQGDKVLLDGNVPCTILIHAHNDQITRIIFDDSSKANVFSDRLTKVPESKLTRSRYSGGPM